VESFNLLAFLTKSKWGDEILFDNISLKYSSLVMAYIKIAHKTPKK
jgi:hypothetical protein